MNNFGSLYTYELKKICKRRLVCVTLGIMMLMLNQESIRDVIAFPKVKDASCLMTEAPNLVDPKQLDELKIGIVKDSEE